MGVITKITLDELNKIFPAYNFTKITPTKSGIVDTTYRVYTQKKAYILKKYERDISSRIIQDTEILQKLNLAGLNVPICLDFSAGWYIYKMLNGSEPQDIKSYHIQALARFLASLHKQTSNVKCDSTQRFKDEILEALNYTKIHFFYYYKRFESLKEFKHKENLFIHGDIFKDNTIFNGNKIGVIDFIDSMCGTYIFDVAVALVGFGVKEKDNYKINLFLLNYNQHIQKKLIKKEILEMMQVASNFYALKRVYKYKNSFKAKELLKK